MTLFASFHPPVGAALGRSLGGAFVALVVAASVRAEPVPPPSEVPLAQTLTAPADVRLGGWLGRAVDASAEQRLKVFIRDETSEPIALFLPEKAEQNTDGRYWGEHAGKWLFAASRAAARTGDVALTQRVRRVADFLVSTQDASGYIGTYPREWRFPARQAELTRGQWDVWVTAYVIMGLLEVNRNFPDERYVAASRRLADLCHHTFVERGVDITTMSNHYGLSATILLEPVADLYGLTHEPRYLALAERILAQANARPEFKLVPKSLAGADAATIAGGKAYQLCWQFFGLAKLYRVTGNLDYLRAAENFRANVRAHHLTLGGGPWGGIGVHREVFNPQDFFNPEGFVETCSIMSWIQLNRELLRLTGKAEYAEEIETAAYNALLGAQDEDGADWCYYTFPNGRRVNTSAWKCCKSSGAMALEELGPASAGVTAAGELALNVYGPGRATLTLPAAGPVEVEQATDYPFAGRIVLHVKPARPARFALQLRIPSWANDATIAVNGKPAAGKPAPGAYFKLERTWQAGDEVVLDFPLRPIPHREVNRSEQDTNLREGGRKVMQTVMRSDYVAVTRGPLVYATGLIDGFKTAETVRLPADAKDWFTELPAAPGQPVTIRFQLRDRAPLDFQPYFLAGGRHDGVWRLTWLQVAPEPKSL